MDLGSIFDEEEQKLLEKAKADIAAEQADPVFQAKLEERMAAREAEPEVEDTIEEPEDEED